jgi:hypothetical protein
MSPAIHRAYLTMKKKRIDWHRANSKQGREDKHAFRVIDDEETKKNTLPSANFGRTDTDKKGRRDTR